MFYEFSDDFVTVEMQDISENFIAAGYINLESLDETAEFFGFSQQTIIQCREDNKYFRSNIEIYDDYCFATLKLINAENADFDSDGIAMYIKKNLFIVVDVYDSDCSVRDKFLKALTRFSPSSVSIERLIYAFLESIVDGDSRFLEDTEFYINEMEEHVFNDRTEGDFNHNLLKTKQMLLLLRNYYEQLIDISEALEENENELFDERDLKYFRVFINKSKRLKDNVDMLRDSVIHLKEAYESSLELKLNQTMKVFTVFTVIFSPLTLIAGWYGMNFSSMPEFNWKYGYAFVILISVITAAITIFIFKKKKWI
ncbi:MAG: CorA family divalent cation transporter [Eubacterium sp.]